MHRYARRPPYKYNRPVSYDEFEARVRRHRPSELLPAIAVEALRVQEPGVIPAKELLIFPWALAAAAKESIRVGNEHRPQGVTKRDLEEICGAFNALFDPFTSERPSEDSLASMLVRTAYEQFPFQISAFEELARPHLVLQDAIAATQTEIMHAGFWEESLGCRLELLTGAVFICTVGAQQNGGYFDEAWLGQANFKAILQVVPADVLLAVLRSNLGTNLDSFRRQANSHRSSDPRIRRYDFNPLIDKPFVKVEETRWIAPIPSLVLRKAMPSGLYHAALGALTTKRQQDAFTRDVGALFQTYVGLQLSQLPNVVVMPEIRYGNDQRSADWFVIWPDLLLVIEAKSTRVTQEARAGLPKLEGDVRKGVGRGFAQITRSVEQIRRRNPAFSHLPLDRPIMGMVVTLEPFFLGNSPLIRRYIQPPTVPTVVASARELEHLIAVGLERPIAPLLSSIADDPDQSRWDLGAALRGLEGSQRNPLLDEAWHRLPFEDLRP